MAVNKFLAFGFNAIYPCKNSRIPPSRLLTLKDSLLIWITIEGFDQKSVKMRGGAQSKRVKVFGLHPLESVVSFRLR